MNDYQDPSLPIDRRVEDLLRRMTVAEKAAMMFHPSTAPAGDGLSETEALAAAERYAGAVGISHFNVLGGEDSAAVAEWHNTLQEIAESTRLGIPITLSSDPRHGFRSNLFTGQALDSLSRWPDYPGIAAIGGLDAARTFGDTMRQEFLAMGIRVLLGPMADIFSEPRWSRGSGTFGEDPERVADLTVAFIEALRGGPELGPESVAAVVKHFPGGGPQLRGDDAHDPRYPEQVYPGGQQELHLRPFERAFAAGATQVMTYYGKPVGTAWPEVGFAFNAPVVQDILRRRLGFDGVVVTDWNLLEAEPMGDLQFGPNGWGLEHLTPGERAAIAIDVGVDQFGGDRNAALIEELVDSGRIRESRLDESIRRLLREKFRLGVFEHRRVDVARTREICGSPEFTARGVRAQAQSLVLATADAPVLATGARVLLDGVAAQAARDAGLVPVTDAAEADAIVVRLDAPFTPGRGSLGDFFHGGTLAFDDEILERLTAYASVAPVFVSVYLERPAILGPLVEVAAAVVGDFGASDAVLLAALQGRAAITGAFPFDIPASMEAVEASREDVPFDTAEPRFHTGFGVRRAQSAG
ncbi:glycoside hydrolase family 3 protein [Microbacterium sp. Au-Mic1]|uniref:glycoside hydrolase family 3 protein n=1 Tax=Microbacterium sp. Au-Mic1 TaxID=2906457 RepID=UPI001E56E943|nr:glycoside hydrolase family 3 N-terminal domain-containing protein [Microbacterium sp. Au-Mic1]MCE4026131.1 glycoside hydrolase family 3 protein [Microbacterium sp. Au-Mic1]